MCMKGNIKDFECFYITFNYEMRIMSNDLLSFVEATQMLKRSFETKIE